MLALCIHIMQIPRMRNLAEDRLQQRRFARTVGTDDGRELSAVYMHIYIVKQPRRAEAHTEIFDFCTAKLITVTAGCGRMMQN